jgi:hypothetical protein
VKTCWLNVEWDEEKDTQKVHVSVPQDGLPAV